MTNIELLSKLESDGWLRQLISRGLLPLKVNLHREIYLQVQAELGAGFKKRQAVRRVADRMDIHENTVWVAIRNMKKE